MRAFLAAHAIDLLPVSSELKAKMHRFGLHTMGAVASMSGHGLSDRFSSEGSLAWSLCNDIDDSPVVPLAFKESVTEHVARQHPGGRDGTVFLTIKDETGDV